MAIIKTKIKEAYDTEENWRTHNPLLLSGQLAFSSDKQGQYKIGDGSSNWIDLPYNSVDWEYVKNSPKKMPNPNTLTFTGAVEDSYDGSTPKTIHIPMASSHAGKVNIATPEDFGAKGDGRTDDSTAFKNAILTGKKVVCDATKKYYFERPVDVRTASKGHLDINHATLLNFHILINLNDSGNDWRQSYPTDKFVIENGAIGSDNWNTTPKDWKIPVVMTGCQMQLKNINFVNQPYILAVANQYLDYMLFDTLLNVQNPELFKSGTLNLDAVNCISAAGTAKRIDDKDTNLSGDSWIFKQCSEFYNKYNPEYRLVCTHGHQPMVFQSCIQSGVKTGLYSQVLFLGCHWEEEQTMPVFGMKYLSSALFISCFFWGNYKLENDPRVHYKNCKFTQTENNDRLPHRTLSWFTDNTSFYDLKCTLEGCCVGGNYIIDTRKLQDIKNAPKHTFNKFKNIRTTLSSIQLSVSSSSKNHANFSIGNNIYDIYLLSTNSMNIANDYIQKTVNITNAKSQVSFQIANAIGGYGIRVIRTEPNGNVYETYGFTDPNFENTLETARNVIFIDYGEWAAFGFNGSNNNDILSQTPSPWIQISKKPTMTINNKLYQAGGVLLTSDNSKISDLNGMAQVSNNFSVSSGGTGGSISVDDTLTQSGEAADSKTVGDKISSIDNLISENLGAFQEGQIPPPPPIEPETSVNLFDVNKAENGYYDVNTGKLQDNSGYKTITLPYKTTDVIRKSKDVEWFSTWILLLDAEQQPILSAINVLSGNNFSNPGWDEWKLPEETLQNEPKYQNARYVKVAVSTFGATKDFNQFMVTINNPIPDHYVPPVSTTALKSTEKATEFVYSEKLAAFIRNIASGGTVSPLPPTSTESILNNKNIVFLGDSIVAGFVQEQGQPNYGSRNGFVEMLQKKYSKTKFNNMAIGGATMAYYSGESVNSVIKQVDDLIKKYPSVDYIILEGGVNDSWLTNKIQLGTITSGYNDSYNESTFCGALESAIKKLQEKYVGKKIGFITTHKIPSSPSLKNYMDKASEICKKWSIPYLDLYNESMINYAIPTVKSNLSYKTSGHSNGDGIHPNILAYETIFVPKIEHWLLSL